MSRFDRWILFTMLSLCRVYAYRLPIPVAARSKAWVYGRSLARIAGSNPTGGMDVCCDCCVLSGRGLCVGLITRPEDSYRLGCVLSVIVNEEAMAHRGLLPHGGG